MDMDEKHLWLALLADWLDRVVLLWHTHRTFAIAVVLTCLLLLRAYLMKERKSIDPSASSNPPSPRTPVEGKISPWSDKKTTQVEYAPVVAKEKVSTQARRGPKLVAGRRPPKARRSEIQELEVEGQIKNQAIVFYCSLTGTTAQLAQDVVSKLSTSVPKDLYILPPQVHDLSYIDLDDFFVSGPKNGHAVAGVKYLYCLLIPSYNIDTIITNFISHLDETHNDFRIDTAPLSSLLGYSVFGVGDREGWPTEADGYCTQAIEVDRWMAKLTGRKRAYPIGLGDVKGNLKAALDEWTTGVQNTLRDLSVTGALGEGVPGSGAEIESGDEEEETAAFPDSGRQKRQKIAQVADLEDVRGPDIAPLPIDFTTSTLSATSVSALKEMVPKTSPPTPP